MTRKGNRSFHNGAIDILSAIIKHVMSSASEAETGALYYGCKRALPYKVTLEEMGHRQPPTPVHCDNLTATGIANDTVKKQRLPIDGNAILLGGRSSQDGKFGCAMAPRPGEPCRLFLQAFRWYAPSRGKTLVPA